MNNLLMGGFILCLVVCYIPQLVQTFKTKNVDGISEMFWIILTTGLICNMVLLFRTNASCLVIAPQAINLICSIAMVSMVSKYSRR